MLGDVNAKVSKLLNDTGGSGLTLFPQPIKSLQKDGGVGIKKEAKHMDVTIVGKSIFDAELNARDDLDIEIALGLQGLTDPSEGVMIGQSDGCDSERTCVLNELGRGEGAIRVGGMGMKINGFHQISSTLLNIMVSPVSIGWRRDGGVGVVLVSTGVQLNAYHMR
jgi:hypothetical protein